MNLLNSNGMNDNSVHDSSASRAYSSNIIDRDPISLRTMKKQTQIELQQEQHIVVEYGILIINHQYIGSQYDQPLATSNSYHRNNDLFTTKLSLASTFKYTNNHNNPNNNNDNILMKYSN